jgi:hypothetical protein
MLCCERLFAGENDLATLMLLVTKEVPSVADYRTDVCLNLWDAFFARAICREPDGRFASANEMTDELTRILESEGLPSPDELPRFLERLPFPAKRGGAGATEIAAPTRTIDDDTAPTHAS